MRIVGPALVATACLVAWLHIRADGPGFRAVPNRLLAAGCLVLAASIVIPAVAVADETTLPGWVVVMLDVVRIGGIALLGVSAWRARAGRVASAPAVHDEAPHEAT
jgi:hypothetical protein